MKQALKSATNANQLVSSIAAWVLSQGWMEKLIRSPFCYGKIVKAIHLPEFNLRPKESFDDAKYEPTRDLIDAKINKRKNYFSSPNEKQR
jgi:hypothetical protein